MLGAAAEPDVYDLSVEEPEKRKCGGAADVGLNHCAP